MGIFREIGTGRQPFIIAEIGVNYYDIAIQRNILPLEAAKLMVKEAKDSGAHAVKFQSYRAETLASRYSPAYWDQTEEPTASQFELFQKFDKFGAAEYKELAEFCRSISVMFLSTPFDFAAADYLYELMDMYKISSSDITNLPFIEYVAKKGKPILLSTGASTIGEIEEAIAVIRKTGNEEICIMHCVLAYPTKYEDANLLMIQQLKAVFPGYLLGFSDHTRPDESMLVLTTAYQYGAIVIEKHFTLDKTLQGNDHYHAMEPTDLKRFCSNIELLKKINGEYYKRPLKCEQESRRQARRSIVALKELSQGEIITPDKIAFKRPGLGIPPKYINEVVGKIVKCQVAKDYMLQWKDFS